MRLILIMVTLLVTFTVTHARDPDLPPPERHGERETVGGSNWSGGDTFVLCGVVAIAVMLVALPQVFDGNLGRIASQETLGSDFGDGGRPVCSKPSPRIMTSNPIRVSKRWVLSSVSGVRIVSHNDGRKSGYPPFFKFPTRRLCGSY